MLVFMKKSKTSEPVTDRIDRHRSGAWAFARAATWGAVATIALGIGHRAASVEHEKLTQHPDRDPAVKVLPHAEGSYTKTVKNGEVVLDTAMLVALGFTTIAALGAAKETAQYETGKFRQSPNSDSTPVGPKSA